MQVTETLRVRRYDSMNVVLEEYSSGVNPRTKEEVSSWKILGYFSNTRGALYHVLKNDILINEDEVETIKEYTTAHNKQVERLTELLNGRKE